MRSTRYQKTRAEAERMLSLAFTYLEDGVPLAAAHRAAKAAELLLRLAEQREALLRAAGLEATP
jgi:hypothetical protein